MIPVEQIKAFTEFCLKPLADDFKQILEKAKELNLPISEGLIRDISSQLVRSHLYTECLRAMVYVLVTVIVCLTVIRVLV